MTALDRAQILRPRSLIGGRVAVPEWADNGTAAEVCIRTLTLNQRRALQAHLRAETDTSAGFSPRAVALIVVAAACTEDGAALFELDDVVAIQELDARPVERIAMHALRSNGLIGDTEDITKNSQPSPSAG
jgi:hypothetical protein